MPILWVIIKRAALWGLIAGGVFLAVGFLTPIILGGQGSHQSPLAGILLAPAGFMIGATLGGLAGIQRARGLPAWAKIVYGLALVVLAERTFAAVQFSGPILVKLATAPIASQADRMRFAAPLTEAERALLERTHFTLTLGVANPKFEPVYTDSLIADFVQTGLFDHVTREGRTRAADLVATMRGKYYGDKLGQYFTLSPANEPGRGIDVKVHYTTGGIFAAVGDRRQYLDRLAVETIKAANALAVRPAAPAQ
jgi:hypothetical protein